MSIGEGEKAESSYSIILFDVRDEFIGRFPQLFASAA